MAHLKLLLLLCVGITVSTGVDLHKRIYGGQKCPDTERQYHVKLKATSATHESLCGGSLIHERWILTAAHCWKNEPGWDMYATLGVHPHPSWIKLLFQRSSDKKKKVKITSGSFFVGINTIDDIMLLEIPSQPGRKTVALPDCANPPNIDKIQMAGYGLFEKDPNTGELMETEPSKLQCVEMDVASCEDIRHKKCYDNVPYDNRMCYKKSNMRTCPGDSGGGVIYDNKIYGVHIGSSSCGCTRLSVSVKVCPYMKWIKEKINPRSNGK
ncbi:anionic trypsin-2-like [Astatotilapia calliptera]|nr:anionic trypsin-2-like [Astatotilapia calliptera]